MSHRTSPNRRRFWANLFFARDRCFLRTSDNTCGPFWWIYFDPLTVRGSQCFRFLSHPHPHVFLTYIVSHCVCLRLRFHDSRTNAGHIGTFTRVSAHHWPVLHLPPGLSVSTCRRGQRPLTALPAPWERLLPRQSAAPPAAQHRAV